MLRVYRYADAIEPVDTGISLSCRPSRTILIAEMKRKGIIKRNAQNKFFSVRGKKETFVIFHARDGFLFELRAVPDSGFYRYFSLGYDPKKNVVCVSCSGKLKNENRKDLIQEQDRFCHFCGEKSSW